MKLRHGIAVVAVALVAAGCGDETTSCPTETPQIDALASGCIEVAGQPVSFPVRLCPSCNQTGAICDVDLSAVGPGSGDIFLDPKVEACAPPTSCDGGPTCLAAPLLCTFTAPSTPGNYTVIVFDPVRNQTRQGVLQVVPSGPESCALAGL